MDSQQLIKYRTVLMGISALMVVACHFHSYLASGIAGRLLGEGFIGVDTFIFCSGFGLVTSWKKSDGIIDFYRKRIKKIFPTFLIITTIVLLFCTYLGTVDYDFKDWLLILTGFGYWIGMDTFFEWYTPAILMLYLIFPFLHRMITINNKKKECLQTDVLGFVVPVLMGGDNNQCISIILPASISLLAGCPDSDIYVRDTCRN